MADWIDVIVNVVILPVVAIFMIYFLRSKRKYDFYCGMLALIVGLVFFYIVIYLEILPSRLDLLPETVSSLAIVWLTLALVWIELAKRSELLFINPVPVACVACGKEEPFFFRADSLGGLLELPSLTKIGKASFPKTGTKFENLYFDIELTNLGNQEIMVKRYYFAEDSERPIWGTLEKSFVNEQTEILRIGPLLSNKSGFHKIHVEAKSALTRVYIELYVYLSENRERITYVRGIVADKFNINAISERLRKSCLESFDEKSGKISNYLSKLFDSFSY